jgi:hypothetical protein
MVQAGNGDHKIKTATLERVCQAIAIDETDVLLSIDRVDCASNAFRISVNTDNLPAMRGQFPNQTTSTTADVERPLTMSWKCTRHKTMVVSIVIPAHPRIYNTKILQTSNISTITKCLQSLESSVAAATN